MQTVSGGAARLKRALADKFVRFINLLVAASVGCFLVWQFQLPAAAALAVGVAVGAGLFLAWLSPATAWLALAVVVLVGTSATAAAGAAIAVRFGVTSVAGLTAGGALGAVWGLWVARHCATEILHGA